jgi:hypothetical protein
MLRNTIATVALTLAAGLTASADFSYTNTMKTTGGSMAAMAGTAADRTSKYYFKGQKIMTTTGDTAVTIDFGAQTVTTVNNAQKTYTVKKFSDLGAAIGANTDVTVDVKDTGQTKVINGLKATEAIVSMNMDMEMGRGAPAMKMQMEMDLWISSEVPGSSEVRAFYEKNMANFPWTAMAGGTGNASVQKAMSQIQQAMAKLKGMPVEMVIRIKSPGGAAAPQMAMPQMPQMSAAQQAQMQAAMSKMTPAQQAQMQAMMGGAARGGAPASASGNGSLIEITGDAGSFSTASVPDSVFAIPDGYKQGQ